MNHFDILSKQQSIHRNAILEASAGTGKTFTIEHLVVRLLTEIDPSSGVSFNLDEILIVTYTKKAVANLKERIRTLIKLKLAIEEGSCQIQLQKALALFEDNQIFTIHSFASKILSENCLETGFVQSEGETLARSDLVAITEDFLQTEFSPPEFSKGQLKCLLQSYGNLKKLISELIRLGSTHHRIEPKSSFQELYQRFCETEEISDDIFELVSHYKKSEVSPEVLKLLAKRITLEEFDQLIKWGEDIVDMFSDENKRKASKLEKLPSAFKEKLCILEEASSSDVIVVNASYKLKRLITLLQENEGRYTFDSILLKAKTAAKNPDFAKSVKSRYKALVIDEFQDTDPVQWDMFETLFLGSAQLFLVGDPKQSIYHFRQADIYTYLKAADQFDKSDQFSLSVNYRSNQALINGINTFFKDTVFPLPKIKGSLPYHPVKAGRSDTGENAFHIVVGKGDKKNLEAYYISYIVNAINKTDFGTSAVLVKDRFQAKRVLDALQEAHIPAICQKETGLIGSCAHTSLIELLEGFINWKNQGLLKIALAGPLLSFTQKIEMDDPYFLKLAEEIVFLRTILFTQGFGLFFEELLAASFDRNFLVGQGILSQSRELYQDLYTIASSVMDAESEKNLTPDQILSYLKEALGFEAEDHEEWMREKETDTKSVKIDTIHSSKGLEYDHVFLLGTMMETKAPSRIVFHDDTIKALLKSEEALYKECCEEMDAEKIRQLYVGVTRARERLILFTPSLKKEKIKMGTASPLDLWLASLGEATEENLLKFLSSQSVISYEILDEKPSILEKRSFLENSIALTLTEMSKRSHEPLLIKSFTSLAKTHASQILNAPSDFENPLKNPFTLPAGKSIGILLHEIFEKIPFHQPYDHLIEKMVMESPFHAWLKVIKEIVQNTLETHLGMCKFKDIKPELLFKEKEFVYASQDFADYLKGAIDLIFMHEKKVYLVDWKTNWLGPSYEFYNKEGMQASMEEHSYTLQARIYAKAVKNYFALFLGQDFDFGGAYYIYLRGLSPNTGIYFVPWNEVLDG